MEQKYTLVDLRSIEDTEELKKYFSGFYKSGIFTFEGLMASEENLNYMCDGLHLDNPTIYVYSGEQMNRLCKLTGLNAYKPELTFVSVQDYYNPIVKLQVGARWFDDIVDNNKRRQDYINGIDEDDDEFNVDFDSWEGN